MAEQNYPTYEDVKNVLNGYSNGVHHRAYIDGVNDELDRITKLLRNRCECTERMLADRWGTGGQTVFCRWCKLVHEIKGENK